MGDYWKTPKEMGINSQEEIYEILSENLNLTNYEFSGNLTLDMFIISEIRNYKLNKLLI
jgi:hypothetical protein